MVDLDAMRTEYIQGGVSYRELAAKYGVPFPTIADRARAEKWVELRRQAHDKAITKTVETVAKQNAKVDDRINRLANRLIDKLEKAVDELDMETIVEKKTTKNGSEKVTTEQKVLCRDREGPVDKGGLQQLTNTLRDLKAILDVRSELDRQEQEARIANLRRQAEADKNPDGAKLVVEGMPEEFTV